MEATEFVARENACPAHVENSFGWGKALTGLSTRFSRYVGSVENSEYTSRGGHSFATYDGRLAASIAARRRKPLHKYLENHPFYFVKCR
jgi:hypothetical protein